MMATAQTVKSPNGDVELTSLALRQRTAHIRNVMQRANPWSIRRTLDWNSPRTNTPQRELTRPTLWTVSRLGTRRHPLSTRHGDPYGGRNCHHTQQLQDGGKPAPAVVRPRHHHTFPVCTTMVWDCVMNSQLARTQLFRYKGGTHAVCDERQPYRSLDSRRLRHAGYEYNITPLTGIRGVIAKNRESYKSNSSTTVFSDTGVQTSLQLEDKGRALHPTYMRLPAWIIRQCTSNLDEKDFDLRVVAYSRRRRLLWVIHPDTLQHTLAYCNGERRCATCSRAKLTLNLNEPCKIEDTSWIPPQKYCGVWWNMIVGTKTWSYTNDLPSVRLGVTDYSKCKPNGTHGATNEEVKRYIDFAAKNGLVEVLVEGWNEGWEDWFRTSEARCLRLRHTISDFSST